MNAEQHVAGKDSQLIQEPRVLTRVKGFLKAVYFRLTRINDSPQRVAIGFGLGVFAGVLPGTGPIAALVLASLFRVNRASALLGSILTNTWLSIVIWMLSIKVGSALVGLSRDEVCQEWTAFVGHFQWASLLTLFRSRVIVAALIGFLVVSLSIGAVSYIAALVIIRLMRGRDTVPRAHEGGDR